MVGKSTYIEVQTRIVWSLYGNISSLLYNEDIREGKK
jgi:hypothetical protein